MYPNLSGGRDFYQLVGDRIGKSIYDSNKYYQDLLTILAIAIDDGTQTPRISGWQALDPIWQGGAEVVQSGLPHQQLPPAWQILLLGDGSPTRHLQLLTGEPTEVDVIDMSAIGMDEDGAPSSLQVLPGPRVRRQVWLRTAGGQRLAYATSWWEARHVDEYLENKSLPIWASLAKLRTELYRDVRGIYYGDSPALATAFGESGPFWGRHYLFWHHGQPLTLIYEVFSPYLQQYLGKIDRYQKLVE
jgi:chorismate lyase